MPSSADGVRRSHVRRWGVWVAGVWLPLLLGVAPARGQEVGFTASMHVARGTYATIELTSVYLFNNLDVTAGPLHASVSVPLIWQRTSLIDTAIDPSIEAAAPGDYTSVGLGDPLIRADVRLVNDTSRALTIAVVGSVKPSVVDADSGLGTGATDVGGGGSVFKAMGRTSVFADALFWTYGDPEGVDFEDSLSYSVGLGRVLGSGRWSAMVSLAGLSRGVAGVSSPVQLNVAMLRLLGNHQSIAITTSVGLTDGSGDFSIGMSWRIAHR